MEILIGLVIGFAIGTTGVGAGTLTAPALILVVGLSPRTAVATALIFSTAVKVWASAFYAFRRQIDFKVLGHMLIGGIPGALSGALFLQHLRNRTFDTWIMGTVGALVVITSVSSMLYAGRRAQTAPRLNSLPILTLPIGLETTFSSAGAGALGTIVLFNFTALAPAVVVGTDLLFGLLVSAIGAAVNIIAGNYAWIILVKLVPAGIVGTLAGSSVARKLPSQTLRTVVLLCAASVGVVLLYKSL
jgi:uncharacterized membrane protein YfcA